MSKLNARQEAFVREYMVDLNATHAYIRAGYSEKGASVCSTKLIAHASVQAAIQIAMKEREERTRITMDQVLKYWADLAFTPMDELFDQGPDGTLIPKSFNDMTGRAKRCISELKSQFDKDGAGWQSIKRLDQLKASEMIAKHLGMFIERREVGQPGEFDKLTDEELEIRLEKEKRFFSIMPGATKKKGQGKPNIVH
tara:strand:+ start:523 stop:1113 length:591 start_codon:yes stop_codon:yes gene_type:complete